MKTTKRKYPITNCLHLRKKETKIYTQKPKPESAVFNNW